MVVWIKFCQRCRFEQVTDFGEFRLNDLIEGLKKKVIKIKV